jgi:hypothetical protein
MLLRYGSRRAETRYAGLPKWGIAPASQPGGSELAEKLVGRGWNLGKLWGLAPDDRDLKLAPLGKSGFVDWWRDQPFLTFVEKLTDPRWHDRMRYLQDPDSDPLDHNAWEYVDSNSYRTNSYPRPAVVLRSLRGLVGQDAFLRGMRNHAETWRYAHTYPDDFIAAFQEGAGQDLSWFFEDLLRTTETVDWSVEVSETRLREPAGFLEVEGGELVLHEGHKPAHPDAPEDEEKDGESCEGDSAGALWRHDVVVRRRGGLRLPVTIRVRMCDGESVDHTWTREMQAASTWWRLPIEAGGSRIRSVSVDPDRLWWIDTDMSNNQWIRIDEDDGGLLAPLRWAERIATQYSHLLHAYAAVGG